MDDDSPLTIAVRPDLSSPRLIVDLAGLLVEVRTERSVPLISEWFERLPQRRSLASAVVQVGSDVVPPPGAFDEAYGPVQIWRTPDATVVASHGCRALVTPETLIIDAPHDVDREDALRVLQVALSYLHAARSSLVLHAAAVVIDGAAIVLLGGSGAGKSTCAAAALQAGLAVAADDLVAIERRPERDKWIVTGLARPLAVPAHLTDALAPAADESRRRMAVPGSVLALGSFIVDAVGLVDHGVGAGEVSEWPSHRALVGVASSSAVVGDPRYRPDVMRAAAALSRLPTWRVRIAPPSDRQGEQIVALLRAAVAGSQRRS